MTDLSPMDSIEFDRSVLGVDVEVGTHLVSREQIIAYSKALGETQPPIRGRGSREGRPSRRHHSSANLL